MRKCIMAVLFASASFASFAEDETAYRTGASEFGDVWHQFYDLADHESEIDDPLIAKGNVMVPAIVEAIRHKNMKHRRYAIGALGFIKSRQALGALEEILNDKSELEYFRGDALQAIYQIDSDLGESYAKKYQYENTYLKMVSDAIFKKADWLTEPSEEID